MKTIGMIGGMSWESTLSYYKAVNEGVKCRLGGLHSAKVVLNSVDFAEIERLQHLGEWGKTADILSDAAVSVEAAGADFFMICTNTMHKVADEITARVSIPLLHIADATAEQLVSDGVKKVGLLGTQFTMEQEFYRGRLTDKFGIEVVIPDSEQRACVHQIIYEELCQGQVNTTSREAYLAIIHDLQAQGAEAVILGCTEIALLVSQQDTKVPLYDTTEIHAKAAVQLALS
ncbi:aspartate/glutamate racemase family protein [uncultured Shewanella sp.]|uniref:aspartate/glutamate racemase family protein n=1 Tax=uncultured Shewanella sp. TaxID=173975 RepID=UPI0026246358|nr:aspartate/glutamate racemase family protein [uncultured Shewanella sp.]